MSSRRQISIPLGDRYRQVSLYMDIAITSPFSMDSDPGTATLILSVRTLARSWTRTSDAKSSRPLNQPNLSKNWAVNRTYHPRYRTLMHRTGLAFAVDRRRRSAPLCWVILGTKLALVEMYLFWEHKYMCIFYDFSKLRWRGSQIIPCARHGPACLV